MLGCELSRQKPHPIVSQVCKLAKQSGREPDVCGFDSHLGDGSKFWKVAGYGWPGHGANVCVLKDGHAGSTPSPSAGSLTEAFVVKWIIMPRFERGVPGSSPGEGTIEKHTMFGFLGGRFASGV